MAPLLARGIHALTLECADLQRQNGSEATDFKIVERLVS
jgi:hypothetical protein